MTLLSFITEKNFPMSDKNIRSDGKGIVGKYCRKYEPSITPDLDTVLEEKFMTSSKFSMEIENLMKISEGSMNYIECIVHYCSENNIELETVSKLISKPLKEKLKYDAQRLNYMKKSSKARLVI